MDWFALSKTPLATVVMFVSGIAAIYFRQQTAAWFFKQDSSHVSRDQKYALNLRSSFSQWSVGIGSFLILNAVININRSIKL